MFALIVSCRVVMKATSCTRKTLCDRDTCEICVPRSFASNEKSIYWNYEKNNNVTPRQVCLNSRRKCWFHCEICGHDFDIALPNITQLGMWCAFCSNSKLCSDDECITCYNKSFCSSNKVSFWNYKKNGSITPRQVFMNAKSKYWFTCNECGHDFETTLANMTQSKIGCAFCVNIKLCSNDACTICFQKSFASSPKVIYWNTEQNGSITPRQLFLKSNQKCYFTCPDCAHVCYRHIGNIDNESWCPFCGNRELCTDTSCMQCYKKSFSSHSKSVFWHPTKNGTFKPRNMFLHSGKKIYFICEKGHEFDSKLNNISNGGWCGFCRNKSEQKLYDILVVDL